MRLLWHFFFLIALASGVSKIIAECDQCRQLGRVVKEGFRQRQRDYCRLHESQGNPDIPPKSSLIQIGTFGTTLLPS